MNTIVHKKRNLFAMVFTGPLVLLVFLFPQLLSSATVSSTGLTQIVIPRMIDLGRNQCTPCKMMAPVLEQLKREYAGAIDIEYINIAENPDAMKKLGIPVRAVPFQVFYTASGKIVKHHYGYMSKEEIVQAFRDLGFDRKAW
jgi:thioredoxin 1